MAMPDQFYKPDKKLLLVLATYIREYRKKHKLTQAQFAELCNFHAKFIQTLEQKHRNISLSAFVQLANGINIKPDKLLKEILSLMN
jgi:transcriptional regulator with XRE-family HTH domain